MTGTAALAYFTLEMSRALTQLGVTDRPLAVVGVTVYERDVRTPSNVVAYRIPDDPKVIRIDVMWWALWTYDKRTLRCVARHEALHVALGHEVWHTSQEKDEQHAQVDALLKSKWNEPAQCGLLSRKERKRA